MKILLTGAGGMVGQNILEHPAVRSHEILTPRKSELNLADRQAVDTFLRKHQPDVVIHSAGRVGGIQANVKNQVQFLTENLEMGQNIVMGARTAGITRLINLGSSCMYPRNFSGALIEEQILTGELEPSNEGYAIAKIANARLCQYISREDAGFAYRTLIPCNLFGRFDKFEPSHSHLIAAIIHKVHWAKKSNRKSVEIWGDGTARREFMDASDLADGLFFSLANFDRLPEMMNVGIGNDHSINEYYKIVADVIGFNGEFTHDLSKPVGMKQKLVSTEKARAFGWQAKSDLKSSIAKTYDYYLTTVHAQNDNSTTD